MNLPLSFILVVLFIHWLADFVLQSDYVAKNKSKSILVLGEHCLIYGACLAVVFGNWQFAIFNTLLHYITDYFTSRLNSYLWAKGDVHNFFVSVGADQLVHYICLFGSYFLFYSI